MLLTEKAVFNKDETNPFRRFCKYCKQTQIQMSLSHKPRKTWWEEQGSVINEVCLCHNFSEYYSDDFIII